MLKTKYKVHLFGFFLILMSTPWRIQKFYLKKKKSGIEFSFIELQNPI